MTSDLDRARAALTRVFGFEGFRPGQEEVLAAVFAGENVLAVMPTGSGKSLLYQLPAIVRPGLTVVVSPLIALMRDQVDQLRAYGLAAGALNSANSATETARVERALRGKNLRLVYVAPERLARPDMPALLRRAGADFLAIDEAHCISQWGHDFRKEYLGLRAVAQALGAIQTIAVTATADGPTRAEIAEKLFTAPPHLFLRSFDRPNLRLAMRPKANATAQIARMIEGHRGDSGIVYCASRRHTEKLAADLAAMGHRALPYHAGMDGTMRGAHQDEFLRSDGVVMVATVAFGMGIDKPDVRFVCHADLPGSIEAYYQEIGRAGRDGLAADTLALYGEGDVVRRHRQIAESDATPARKHIEIHKLEALIALCETPRCRRQTLLAAFGESAEACGNCDICAGEIRFFDGMVEAQKVMSAILRTSGRFFANHIANILTGEATAAIRRHTHDGLRTFGAGRERNASEWRSIFRQLHAAELIARDLDEGRWVVTPQGRRVLRGEDTIALRAPAASKRAESSAVASAPATRPAPLSTGDASLFAALKAKRLELAQAERLPAYVVFPDRTLLDIVARRPRTAAAMALVHGVGEAKLAKYGSIFLDVVARHESGLR
jgi:ATP-dependent DNA helicase RecQ